MRLLRTNSNVKKVVQSTFMYILQKFICIQLLELNLLIVFFFLQNIGITGQNHLTINLNSKHGSFILRNYPFKSFKMSDIDSEDAHTNTCTGPTHRCTTFS